MNISDRFNVTFDAGTVAYTGYLPNVTFIQSFDANGDGITDLLVATDNYGNTDQMSEAQLLLGTSDGGFEIGATLPGRYVPRDMAFGDFNGDGVTDFYVAYTGPDIWPAPGERDVLMLSKGDGWRATGFPNPTNGFTHAVAAGDIDDDGDLDLFAMTNGSTGNAQPFLLINDGTGSFTMERSLLPETISTQNTDTSGRRQQWAEFIDVNNDGLVDLVTGKQEEPGSTPLRTSVLYLNQGGSFDDAHSIVLPDHPSQRNAQEVIGIDGVDLDGDGDIEVVVMSQGRRANGYTDEWALQVFSVSDDGTLTEETERWFGENGGYFRTGQHPYFLDYADVNGDGRLDILPYLNGGGGDDGNTPLMFLNGGDGVFEQINTSDVAPDLGFLFGTSFVPVIQDGVLRLMSFTTDNNGTISYSSVDQIADLPAVGENIFWRGTAAADVHSAGGGNDTMRGHAGNDSLAGPGGNDLLDGAYGYDTLVGGAGRDTLLGGADNDRLLGGAGNDMLRGGGHNDRLYGGAGADTLKGEAGNDLLSGGGSNDRLIGGTGNDTLRGDSGRDALIGGGGKDVLNGGGGDDRLVGGGLADQLLGAAGADTLLGGSGNDTLNGGDGNDRLTGGTGVDLFVFSRGQDTVTDFGSADLLDLAAATGISGFSDLLNNHVEDTSDGVVITDDNGHNMLLGGVALADLSADAFEF